MMTLLQEDRTEAFSPFPVDRTLNFIVTGQVRCGAAVVQTSICRHSRAYCHGDLLHEDESIRRKAHEAYFGPSRDPRALPEWYALKQPEGRSNPERYLTSSVFDHARYEEAVLGVKVLYPVLQAHDLWEYCEDRYKEGDFCVVHVLRNPIACFVSLKQAQQSGVWQHEVNSPAPCYFPRTVHVDVDELIPFIRHHEASLEKVRRAIPDALEIEYQDLRYNYAETVNRLFRFLELPWLRNCMSGIHPLKSKSFYQRIANFKELRRALPLSMQRYLEPENLI